MRSLFKRLLFLFRRDAFTREMDEELQFHLDMKTDELTREGAVPAAEARAAARRRVGNALHLREASRDPWILTTIEQFAQDVRHALRLLRRDPTFTIAALATLALGIGLNTAIFSVAYGVLWRPLPYQDPDRLVMLRAVEQTDRGIRTWTTWTPSAFLDMRVRNDVFETVMAYTPITPQMTGRGEPLELKGLDVTPDFFATLGVSPMIGRTFLTGAAAPDDDGSVVIGERLWRAALQADRGIVGRTITLDGLPKTIVGVMPREFAFRTVAGFGLIAEADVWVPNRYAEGGTRNAFLSVVGRLKPGLDRAQAEAQLTTMWRRHSSRVDANTQSRAARVTMTLTSLRDQMVAGVRTLLLVLVGAVGFVLLIACVNVTNLQMARLSARRTELSVRAALGAGRHRIIRQLLTESIVLSIVGGTLGVLLAQAAIAWMLPLVPDQALPRMESVRVDRLALAFCAGVCVLTSVIVGLLPAMRFSALDSSRALHAGGSRTATDRQGERVRTALVATQIALTLVLLIGAGLLIHSFVRLVSVAPGFQPASLQTITVTLPDRLYPKAAQMQTMARTILDGMRRVPGIESATIVNAVPFGDFYIRGTFQVDGQPAPDFVVAKPKIESEYFKTMGMPILEGRDFTAQDDWRAPKVAIVSQGVARRLWPKGDALGHRLRLDGDDWLTIVGIVPDVRPMRLEEPPVLTVYVPFQQETRAFFLQVMSFVWRPSASAGNAANTVNVASTADAVRAEIRRAAPDVPIERMIPLDDRIARSVDQPRFRTLLLGLFALAATSIATCGIYGLMAYAVAQRRREIGVRVALGAERHDVLRLVLGRALRVVSIGVTIGLLASLLTTRVLRNFLYGITPNDPIAFGAVTLLLIAIGLLAAWLPARRAARIDPVTALRAE